MAKIEKKQSEIEKALNLASYLFKSRLKHISQTDNLELYIQVRGVPIETLVQTSEEIKTATDSGMTCDLTNHYVNLEFDNVHLSLNTLNEY
jgi:hypothetical protein